MSVDLEYLDYLREPRFANYSVQMFGSAIRLPVLGAIFELTPVPEEDTFYARQISEIIAADPGNALKEIQRTESVTMIRRLAERDHKRRVDYTRLPSLRWNIVEIALKSAKEELSLLE